MVLGILVAKIVRGRTLIESPIRRIQTSNCDQHRIYFVCPTKPSFVRILERVFILNDSIERQELLTCEKRLGIRNVIHDSDRAKLSKCFSLGNSFFMRKIFGQPIDCYVVSIWFYRQAFDVFKSDKKPVDPCWAISDISQFVAGSKWHFRWVSGINYGVLEYQPRSVRHFERSLGRIGILFSSCCSLLSGVGPLTTNTQSGTIRGQHNASYPRLFFHLVQLTPGDTGINQRGKKLQNSDDYEGFGEVGDSSLYAYLLVELFAFGLGLCGAYLTRNRHIVCGIVLVILATLIFTTDLGACAYGSAAYFWSLSWW